MQIIYTQSALPKKLQRYVSKHVFGNMGIKIWLLDLALFLVVWAVLMGLMMILLDWNAYFVQYYEDNRVFYLMILALFGVMVLDIYATCIRPKIILHAMAKVNLLQIGQEVRMALKADYLEIGVREGVVLQVSYDAVGEVYTAHGFVILFILQSNTFYYIPQSALGGVDLGAEINARRPLPNLS